MGSNPNPNPHPTQRLVNTTCNTATTGTCGEVKACTCAAPGLRPRLPSVGLRPMYPMYPKVA